MIVLNGNFVKIKVLRFTRTARFVAVVYKMKRFGKKKCDLDGSLTTALRCCLLMIFE